MGTESFKRDPSFKYPILISTIPFDQNEYSFTSGVLGASSQLNITWTTEADRPQLSLWDFLFTVRFGLDDAAHDWPDGPSLTLNQILVEVSIHVDALASNDFLNNRVCKVVLKNNSADAFNYYAYLKAYTFATSVGTTV